MIKTTYMMTQEVFLLVKEADLGTIISGETSIPPLTIMRAITVQG